MDKNYLKGVLLFALVSLFLTIFFGLLIGPFIIKVLYGEIALMKSVKSFSILILGQAVFVMFILLRPYVTKFIDIKFLNDNKKCEFFKQYYYPAGKL